MTLRQSKTRYCAILAVAAAICCSGFVMKETAAVYAQASRLFSQDVTLEESTTTSGMPMGGANKPSTATSYFSGNAMRRSSSEGSDMIMRYDQGKMFQIDHKQKTYTEISFEQLQQAINKASASAGADSQKAAEAMKQLLGQTMGQVTVNKEGPGETIAGYTTEKYLVNMPPMEMQIWAAPELTLPPVYYDAMKLQAKANPMFDMGKMMEEFKKIKGMHMKTVSSFKMMGMNMVTTTVVTSVSKGAIPASTFEIPSGYTARPFKF